MRTKHSRDKSAKGAERRSVWPAVGLLISPFIIIVAVIVGLQVYWFAARTTEGDVRNLIDNNLSASANSNEIFDFLDSRGIEHTDVKTAEYTSVVLDAGYPKGTNIIAAIVRNTSRSFFGTGDIQIFFILDSALRLEDYIVQEGFTSF